MLSTDPEETNILAFSKGQPLVSIPYPDLLQSKYLKTFYNLKLCVRNKVKNPILAVVQPLKIKKIVCK